MYRALMLEAYASHPEAFTSSADERAALPLSWWEGRLSQATDAAELVMGSFQSHELVGVAGLSFDSREKVRHKATLFGMYVPSSARGHGVGAKLVLAALAEARSRPGIKLVQLTVTHGNHAAEALYRKHGFVRFGLEPFAVGIGNEFVSKVHMWCNVEATRGDARVRPGDAPVATTPGKE